LNLLTGVKKINWRNAPQFTPCPFSEVLTGEAGLAAMLPEREHDGEEKSQQSP
jgi:hypothetical protein